MRKLAAHETTQSPQNDSQKQKTDFLKYKLQ